MAGDGGAAAERVAAAVEAAAAGGWEFRNAYRRQLLALSRRIRLLGPFAEELREARRGPADGEKERERERALAPLGDALEKALDLLRLGRDGSRIFLVLERDNVMKKFQGVIAQLEQALCDFPYDKLDISDEVREQDPGEHIEKMSMLLKKIKDFVQTQNPEMGPPIGTKLIDSNGEPRPVNIPDEFRCPISLKLMKDPVIVATGQTYERVCIEKWLASGHHTCPNTQQRMTNTTLTPNYVLRSLIAQWCEANGVEQPKRSSQPNKPASACSSSERANIDALLSQLCSHDPEEQRSAAAELRLLAKRNANNRICIAEAGAIPLLLSLLSSSDLRTQEHAVTALLNLSIHEDIRQASYPLVLCRA
ncbi:protein spotted leaf 11-like [Panicum miliaceum]|uniref:RING-type E3 ubiquitin transferase n=1 Tax=Panicum miliaceum TaxID=4540 RepID=A0A3L6SW32_PANMI|nr:protein spotted leaf 11-like [Panicum miliaceum]